MGYHCVHRWFVGLLPGRAFVVYVLPDDLPFGSVLALLRLPADWLLCQMMLVLLLASSPPSSSPLLGFLAAAALGTNVAWDWGC